MENDHPADLSHAEEWEHAIAPTRHTALRAASLRSPDDDLRPPSTDSDHPLPEVWVKKDVLELCPRSFDVFLQVL